jgi:hypothetical protein
MRPIGVLSSLVGHSLREVDMDIDWHWQGASGAWYKHAVLKMPGPLLAVPANYIAVRRGQDGTRRAIFVGETWDLSGAWQDHKTSGLLAEALELGVNEVHVCFGGRTKAERSAIEADLRAAQQAPLDCEPAPSYAPPGAWAIADPIVEFANMLNARSAATGRQTPIWA